MLHPTVQEEEIVDHSDSIIKTTLDEEQEPSKKEDKGKNVIEGTQFKPKPHFPQRLINAKKDQQNGDIYEVFKQVRINILLLDVIKQTPLYAKFLKDLCTVKRKINVHEKAFLTEQVSAILQLKTPPKYKDLGSLTITCITGSQKVDRVLLDLGASVNLLLYSVYQQLGLGELKPTRVTL